MQLKECQRIMPSRGLLAFKVVNSIFYHQMQKCVARQYIIMSQDLRKGPLWPKLVIGDIKSTLKTFKKNKLNFPIGFISFDLDFYSSTVSSFEIFKINDDMLLPRVECYMDDVGSTELLVASKGTGVLRAIDEFNSNNENEKKLFKKEGVGFTRIIPSTWNEQMYVFHSFNHSKYNHLVLNSS